MKQVASRRRSIGELVVACALVLVAWTLVVRPMQERLARDTANITAHQHALDAWTSALAARDELPAAEIDRARRAGAVLAGLASEQANREGLYDTFRGLAVSNGVELDRVEPASRDSRQGSKSSVVSVAVRFEASGSFECVLGFIDAVESIDPASHLDELSMRTARGTEAAATVSVSGVLRLYAVRPMGPEAMSRIVEVPE